VPTPPMEKELPLLKEPSDMLGPSGRSAGGPKFMASGNFPVGSRPGPDGALESRRQLDGTRFFCCIPRARGSSRPSGAALTENTVAARFTPMTSKGNRASCGAQNATTWCAYKRASSNVGGPPPAGRNSH